MLLPLDALKIKRQVNPEAFRGRGALRIFMEEGTTLYRGWGWTMARNAPGSFAVCQIQWCSTNLAFIYTRFVPAFWRLSCDKGLRPWSDRLLQGYLDTKFHRLCVWCCSLHYRRRPIRCHQDSHPKR